MLMGPNENCQRGRGRSYLQPYLSSCKKHCLNGDSKGDNAPKLYKGTKGVANLRAESLAGSPLQSLVIYTESAARVSKKGCENWRLCYILRLSASFTYVNGGENSSPLHATFDSW